MFRYKLFFIVLVFLLCNAIINANIIRGTEYDEIYLSLPWFGDYDGVYYVILHSVNNGESVSLKYTSRYPVEDGDMPIGYLVSDATPGYFYNYPWNEGPYGLWVTWNYGESWFHVDQTSSRSTYIGGCIEGEVYKRYRGETFISNDYGQNFVQIASSPSVGVSDIGHSSGELYGRTGGIYNSDLSIYRSTDYGATYTLQSHFDAFELGNSYKTMIRGAEEGEVYLIMNNSSYQYNIYYSNDYGQSFQLQHQTNIPNIHDWDKFFSAGRRPGSFYIMINRPDDDLIYTYLKVFYSSDYGQTFTEYFHHLNEDLPVPVTISSFTTIVTQSNFVQLQWVTQSETNMIGYNLYRSQLDDFGSSYQLNLSIIPAHNSSMEQSYTFTDEEVEPEQTYFYWLESVELDGNTKLFGPTSLTIENPDIEELPNVTVLKAAYPNPFNPTTTISFDIKEGETGILTIFNMKGQKIVSENFAAGTHEFKWIADNNASGVYFYKLRTESYSKVNKILLLK